MITMMLFQTTRNTVTKREYPESTLASCCFGWSFRWFSGWVVSWWKISQENFEPKRVTRRCALWSWKHPKGKKHLCLMASKKMGFSDEFLMVDWSNLMGKIRLQKGGPSGNKWNKNSYRSHTPLNTKKYQTWNPSVDVKLQAFRIDLPSWPPPPQLLLRKGLASSVLAALLLLLFGDPRSQKFKTLVKFLEILQDHGWKIIVFEEFSFWNGITSSFPWIFPV